MKTVDTTLISKVEEQTEVPLKKMKILEPVEQPAGEKSSNQNTTCNNNDHQNQGGNNLFLYAESKRARMDRHSDPKSKNSVRKLLDYFLEHFQDFFNEKFDNLVT